MTPKHSLNRESPSPSGERVMTLGKSVILSPLTTSNFVSQQVRLTPQVSRLVEFHSVERLGAIVSS